MTIKKISLAFVACLLGVACAMAQNTYSPYSALGLGEIVSGDNSQTAGMAGVGIGVRNPSSLNISNPAAIAAIDTLAGIFEVGVFAKGYNYRNSTGTDNAFAANFNKLAFGFRGTNKWWSMSLGLKPFSNVGYRIRSESAVEGQTASQVIYLEGSGGLYNLYATNAFRLGPYVSLGVTSSMIAGSYTQKEDQTTFRYETESNVVQFYNKFGLQLHKGNWTLGATYGYKQKLSLENNFSVYAGSNTLQSTEKLRSTNQFIPESYGMGASYRTSKLLVAAEYETEKWKGLQSGNASIGIGDVHRAKVGVAYTPYKDAYTAHKAKQYQFGVGVNKSYIELKNKAAWNFSVSSGVVIPLRVNQSQRAMLNLGVEYGSNLTAPSGYLKENYVMISANFSLIEAMFMRRKIF